MRKGVLKDRRGMWVGAGALAAGLLSGCQGAGTQIVPPGAGRDNVAVMGGGTAPSSPAFAQVAAGQSLPVAGRPAGGMTAPPGSPMVQAGQVMPPGQMMLVNGVPTYTGQPAMVQQPMVLNTQPMVGSGGMVYPVGYTPAGPAPMGQPMAGPQMMAGQMMAGQMMPQGQVMTLPGATMPAGPPPGLSVINTPNGPQYVITETPPAQPAPPATSSYTAPGATPSFMAPTPSTVPAPAMPFGTPADGPAFRAPEPLPSTVGSPPATPAPPGAVLPAAGTGGQRLGSFPPPPAAAPTPGGFKLPPATGPADDDIPAAPVFVPTGK